MEVGKLTVQARKNFGKGASRRYRAEGLVPGIVYGPMLEAPLSFTTTEKALKLSLDPVKRTNTVIEVSVEGADAAPITVMVKDWQIDAIRRELTHVDLIAIDLTKEVEAEVPLHISGKAKAAVEGGQIALVRRVIPVLCTPDKIPTEFVFDVTELEIGDAVHISDLQMPEGVRPAVSEKLTIITCVAPKGEDEKAAAAGAEEGAEAPAEAKAEGEEKKDDAK